jgi:hypothetical protein
MEGTRCVAVGREPFMPQATFRPEREREPVLDRRAIKLSSNGGDLFHRLCRLLSAVCPVGNGRHACQAPDEDSRVSAYLCFLFGERLIKPQVCQARSRSLYSLTRSLIGLLGAWKRVGKPCAASALTSSQAADLR